MPDNLVARFQVLEYIRAFLMGRMAWSRLNGLLLISGAMGMFDKDIVIKCGGYNHNTVGEDMELIVRMRRYMHEQNLEYKVVYVPDPLCWTESPSNLNIYRDSVIAGPGEPWKPCGFTASCSSTANMEFWEC